MTLQRYRKTLDLKLDIELVLLFIMLIAFYIILV